MSGPLADALAALDEAVDAAAARVRSPALDGVAYRLSSAADHSLLWHVCGAARALRRGSDVAWAARFTAALGVESALTNGPVKLLFGKVRPFAYEALEFRHGLRRPITSSFPSGHATAGFCAATLLGGGPGWYALATAVAATRVYVRLHRATDVIAGAALGLGLGRALRAWVGE